MNTFYQMRLLKFGLKNIQKSKHKCLNSQFSSSFQQKFGCWHDVLHSFEFILLFWFNFQYMYWQRKLIQDSKKLVFLHIIFQLQTCFICFRVNKVKLWRFSNALWFLKIFKMHFAHLYNIFLPVLISLFRVFEEN